jgi:hypothetical protein
MGMGMGGLASKSMFMQEREGKMPLLLSCP